VDALSALQRRERMIAVVRVVALLLGVGLVAVYEPPVAGLQTQADAARVRGYALCLLLAVVVVGVEVLLRAVRTAGALRRAGVVVLAADVAVAIGFAWVYAFDPLASPWAVLTVLPLEGALRFQLRGALAVWIVSAPAVVLRDVVGADVAFSPGNGVYRVLLLLVVALFAGGMARDLEQQRRLLAGVADGSRQLLGRVEPAEIFRVLSREAARSLDSPCAVVYVHDGSSFQAVASWPPEALVEILEQDVAEGQGGASRMLSTPTWLPADGQRPGRLAVPLRAAGKTGEHVLVVRARGHRRFSRVQQQAAAAFAEAAALALATTRLVTAEQRTSRRLRTLEALRTRFVATVAHDLRLPLTVFKGVANLLRTRREAISSEQVDAMLASVERQANRLSRLADDLLDAARLDADRLALRPEPVDVRTVVHAVVADSEEDVAVEVPGDVQVVADASRLERILWNLLSNAEKYGKPPFAVSAAVDGAEVVLCVRDHGSGLTPEQQGRLFSDFAGSDDAASVGLGLAIVWQLVDAHGGTVAYEDALPGARFVVRLPADGPPGHRPAPDPETAELR
jgi:K+-sensing histidine kinase KdpD